MDRVQLEICIPVLESDIDDDEVVDVVQVLPKHVRGEVGVDVTDDNVSSHASHDLVRNMAWKLEATLTPGNIDLDEVSVG